jgi:alginate O-acetyltransferase complex protein AlgI
MLFNSLEFLIFLPIVIIIYYILPHKFRWVLLLAASYYFYMAWNPKYIVLIVFSTLVDYFAAILMEKQKNKARRKVFLLISLAANLGLLFLFKYFNFANGTLGRIFNLFADKPYPIGSLSLLLPIGISFYTFQTLSYTIDVYRGTRKPEKHFGYFALFVTFFPQLVAGPIERSDRLIPQLKIKHKLNYNNTVEALLRISWGFFKKVVVAGRIAVIVNTVYNDLGSFSSIHYIVATVGFAIQIYCDFSAYSDIAIGSAKILGINLMENFKMPYFSASISEFWSRWHISLSTWFKDYLYIPLGGNRVDKKWKVYRNLLIVFVVSGLWHGANYTFIAWGLLHGGYLVIERLITKSKTIQTRKLKIPLVIKQLITIILVLISWVFFRANSITDALIIFKNILTLNITASNDAVGSLGLVDKEIYLLIISVAWLFTVEGYKYYRKISSLVKKDFLQGLSVVFLILFIIVFGYYGDAEITQFIYFQF